MRISHLLNALKRAIQNVIYNKILNFSKYCDVVLNGVKYKVIKDSIFIGFAKNLVWEPDTFKIYSKYLNKDSIYLDIGTFTGPTIFIAHSLGVRNINGIEANPETFKIINSNLSINNIKANVFNFAITNQDNGSISFGYNPIVKLLLGNSSSKINSGKQFLVSTITLTTFIEKNNINPDFIKIDIEGAESFVIEDLKKISNRPIVVFLSIHIPNLIISDNITKIEMLNQFMTLCDYFNIFSEKEEPINKDLFYKKLTEEDFFEILLISKKYNNN